ncbi:MAG TPA: hypothetical protein PLJ38_02530 [bacterium]|nr:hypothetical protein [bacterium]
MKNEIKPPKYYTYMSAADIASWLIKQFTLVILCLTFGYWMGVKDYLTMVYVCLLCGTITVIGGLRAGGTQFVIMLLGSAIAWLFLQLKIDYHLIIGFSIVCISLIVIYFNYQNLLPIAYFSVLYIGIFGKDQPLPFFYDRIKQMAIAIPTAIVINYIFGVSYYKEKLTNKLLKIRKNTFLKINKLVYSLKTKNHQEIEKELNSINQYYEHINYIINVISDIEAEYKSFFSFLYNKIPDLRLYKLYIWNIHDLLQLFHSISALSFKEQIPDCLIDYYSDFAKLLLDYLENSKIEIISEFSNKYQQIAETCKIDYPQYSGNLISALLILKTVNNYEDKLILLKNALKK